MIAVPHCCFRMVREEVIMTYKRMLTLAKRLPPSDKQYALTEIRKSFRLNREEQSAEK